MRFVPMVPGWAVNAALGREAVDPGRSYPITWRQIVDLPPRYGLLRCQVMDRWNNNACHLPVFPTNYVYDLPQVSYLLGDET